MLVYRWEHPLTGMGAYQHDAELYQKMEHITGRLHNGEHGRPGWDSDAPFYMDRLEYGADRRAGFASLEQAAHWFAPIEETMMHAAGLELRVYDVAEYRVVSGRYQVIFDMGCATHVDTLQTAHVETQAWHPIQW